MVDATYVCEEQAGDQGEQRQPYLLYQWCSENTACVMLCQAIWETQGKGTAFAWLRGAYHSVGRKKMTHT